MYDQSFTPILSIAIGLVGTLVAGFSVYFTYKGRHNLLRQVIYGRQIDAYFAITEAMTTLYNSALNVLAFRNPRSKEEDARAGFRAALREEHETFTGTVNRSLIVLPSKVKAAVDYFNESLLALSAPADERQAERRAAAELSSVHEQEDAEQELDRAYERAINSIRHHLAIDSLTTGMLKEMGIGSESVVLKSAFRRVNPLVPVGRTIS